MKALAASALAIAATCTPAAAQQMLCAPVDQVKKFLLDEHNETVVTTLTNLDGTFNQVLADPDDGSWSLLVVRPDPASPGGFTACLVVYGVGFSLGDVIIPADSPA